MTAPNTSVTSPANGTTAVHTILTQLDKAILAIHR